MFVNLPLFNPAIQPEKGETRLVHLPAACLFGDDPVEQPHVLHCFVPWLQVVPHVRGHATLASMQFMPRVASLHVLADGI